ncbi:MAG: MBL fold metallo-hydrolase [Candidatus Brocadiaceae bacterium]
MNNVIFETLTVGPLEVNCYVLGSEKDKTAIIIDAGGDSDDILKILRKHTLTLKYLINTHAHFDHVGGIKQLQDMTGAQFLLHEDEIPLLRSLNEQTNAFGLPKISMPQVDRPLKDGDKIVLGNETVVVIHTPGHSPGSICLLMENIVFTGDTLFAGSIGRTDLYGGSYDNIIHSIKTRLFALDERVMAYPGHGPCTTIGHEKQHNPFFQQ